jgi:hypothetical protein
LSEYQDFVNVNEFLDVPYMCNQHLYDDLVKDINNFKPTTNYEALGKELLKLVLLPSLDDKFIYKVNGESIGFEYQRNYEGLMADETNKNRPKRGLFDFKIHYSNQLNTTHFQVFQELINHSNLQNCQVIWDGVKIPKNITQNMNERLVLHKLMLMMFEQEVNWGDEQFQEFSAFPPSYGAEPRDMLMGFIDMMYKGGQTASVDNIPDWKTKKKTKVKMTPIFGQENKYAKYDKNLKATHFKPYRGNATAGGLMKDEMRSLFLRTSNLFLVNF